MLVSETILLVYLLVTIRCNGAYTNMALTDREIRNVEPDNGLAKLSDSSG